MTSPVGWLDKQDTPEAHVALAASDYWWGLVQRLRAIQLLLVVLLPTVLAIVAQFAASLLVAAGLLGFILTFIDTVAIYPYIGILRRRAAQGQDIFDAIALSIPRSSVRQECDPDPSDLQIASSKQDLRRATRNINWYSPVLGKLPLSVGRIACMLESVVWDGGLRDRYCRIILGTEVVIVLAIVAYAVLGPHRDELAMRILFPLTSAIVWTGREWWDQFDASKTATRLRERLQRLWSDVVGARISALELDAAAVDIAAALFAYRSETPPAPHILYVFLRPKQSTSMERAAAIRVDDYQSARY